MARPSRAHRGSSGIRSGISSVPGLQQTRHRQSVRRVPLGLRQGQRRDACYQPRLRLEGGRVGRADGSRANEGQEGKGNLAPESRDSRQPAASTGRMLGSLIMKVNKKLIEVALPLDAINIASAREKSIRHGHPSTLHLWWARRPLAAARAVNFRRWWMTPRPTQTSSQPRRSKRKSGSDSFASLRIWSCGRTQRTSRSFFSGKMRFGGVGGGLCRERGSPGGQGTVQQTETARLPRPVRRGALPLEAQRLGLDSFASDLNPVAVLINKAMIEIPPKFVGRAPVNSDGQRQMAQMDRNWRRGPGPSRGRAPLRQMDARRG